VDLAHIHYFECMKTITINVSEPVYAEFQQASKAMGRPTSELIREAMEYYRNERLYPRRSMKDFRPRSVGKVLKPLDSQDDLLNEMFQSEQ
jgi:hypothetical protein